MKIVVIGATGTVGSAVIKELSPRHEIVKVGKKSGDVNVDITDNDSIAKMYEAISAFDALIATTGNVHFGDFNQLTDQEFYIGIKDKLMEQVNLVPIGKNYINSLEGLLNGRVFRVL
jgi:putative NADH-flavin reductase